MWDEETPTKLVAEARLIRAIVRAAMVLDYYLRGEAYSLEIEDAGDAHPPLKKCHQLYQAMASVRGHHPRGLWPRDVGGPWRLLRAVSYGDWKNESDRAVRARAIEACGDCLRECLENAVRRGLMRLAGLCQAGIVAHGPQVENPGVKLDVERPV